MMCSIDKNSTMLSKRRRLNRYISTLVLMVFLCAFISHSDHITSQASQFEQQDCYLCYQGLDTVEANNSVSIFVVKHFQNVVIHTELMLAHTPYFGLAKLRAPPRF
ncbi:hypothetical protein [Colwellia sp. RSH04]|uniref:hypothetical protein n=1 Tax=Colwellia sp. RSH04 TaxID=2305464 RepID=UPI000E56C1E5|nr:hypothetical protein [Colwellia sp. RSH04]RHW76602.1 hypothetical protein D1094_05800 [Colwellia sp. RSH04]